MWSDPIDNALANIATLLDQLTDSSKPVVSQIEQAKGMITRARECREFEKKEGRIVTPQDPF